MENDVITLIDQCMHLKRQEIGFEIEREKPYCNLFLHFINPVSIMYNGKLVKLGANCCYICTTDSYVYYKAEYISMLHNFVHFSVDDISDLEKYGVPLNTPFYTDLQEEITLAVERMEWAMNAKTPEILPPIINIFEDLLYKLGEEKKQNNASMGYAKEHSFNDLRSQVYARPSEWTVERMAESVHISRSHFSVKYKEMFGVTPNADINNAALLASCKLLSSTDYTVEKIGKMVGFPYTAYFITVFKKKYGVTPNEYRKTYCF